MHFKTRIDIIEYNIQEIVKPMIISYNVVLPEDTIQKL